MCAPIFFSPGGFAVSAPSAPQPFMPIGGPEDYYSPSGYPASTYETSYSPSYVPPYPHDPLELMYWHPLRYVEDTGYVSLSLGLNLAMSKSAELDRGSCPRPVIHPFPEDLWRGVPVTSKSTTPVIAGIPMRSTKVIVNLPNHRDIITAATILQGRLCITPHLPNLLRQCLSSQPVCVATLY